MGTRGTILLAEDTPEIAALVREALGDEGYRVLVATTVADALDILAALRVGLVITDAFRGQPEGDPWSPLAPLVAAAGASPLILSTAHRPADYADFADRGFAACLPKPFDLDDLAALVTALLPRGRGGAAVPDPALRPSAAAQS